MGPCLPAQSSFLTPSEKPALGYCQSQLENEQESSFKDKTKPKAKHSQKGSVSIHQGPLHGVGVTHTHTHTHTKDPNGK